MFQNPYIVAKITHFYHIYNFLAEKRVGGCKWQFLAACSL